MRLKRIYLGLLVLVLVSTHGYASGVYNVGVTQKTYEDTKRKRSLDTIFYYPTRSKEQPVAYSQNIVFEISKAVVDAPLAQGKFPLVIFSHGSGGNNLNVSYLATALAQKGFVVAAANHPGSTTGNSIPQEGTKLYKQVEDISFLIDAVLADTTLSPYVEEKNIGLLGHSKGGYSVLALVGVQISMDAYIQLCSETPQNPNCSFYVENNVDISKLNRVKMEKNYEDKRVKFAIALDPGGGEIITNKSVQNISVPTFILGASYYKPSDKTRRLNLKVFAESSNSNITYKILRDASHFSFINRCTEKGVAIFAEEGEGEICHDGERTRADIQNEVIQEIYAFIKPLL